MNLVTIAGIVISVTLLLALILGYLISRLSVAVTESAARQEIAKKAYNPNVTKGFEIKLSEESDQQIREARKLAAKQAAQLPRGANMRIFGDSPEIASAFDGVDSDPMTAAKIAEFHSWQGVSTGIVAVQPAAVAGAVAQAGAPTRSISDLKPGVDYEFIEISEGMPSADKRNARIANAKARSAAIKALKAGGAVAGDVAPAAVAAAPVVAAAAPAAVNVPPPPEYIEISDGMDPAEARKARIANAKMKSAYNKALKEAGATPGAPPASAPAAPARAVAAPPAPAAVNAPPPPEYIEISDGMDPAEARKARIANAKMKSAYNKALKEAGIDPKAMSAPTAAPATTPAAVAPAPAAAAPTPALGAANAPPPPEYIVISDGMDPAEARNARIANAKMKSAYNKALKAAGIDPKSIQ